MRRRGRARQVAKWGGVALCTLVAAAGIASMYRLFPLRERNFGWSVWVFDGQLVVRWNTFPGSINGIPRTVFGWYRWTPELSMLGSVKQGVGWLSVPCWNLFVLLALTTAFLWVRDRRRIPPGHCQRCGYDLTGNVSGVCPECGEKV